MKQVTAVLFFAATWLWLSCENEILEPDLYHLSVNNDYFETIDTLRVDTFELNGLKPGSMTKWIKLEKGVYFVSVHTASHLRIDAELSVKGPKRDLLLSVHKDGMILLE